MSSIQEDHCLLLSFVLAATPLENVSDLMNRWWIVAGDRTHATFVERRSVTGTAQNRRIDVLNILPRTVGIKAQSMTYEFDCEARLVTTLRLEGLNDEGRNLGPIPTPKARRQPIIANSVGDYVSQFACGETQGQDPKIGYASLLPPFKAADHYFRLLGIGLDAEIAAGMAGINAEAAPRTFENLLNALVPTEKHLLVRAIKTPNAELVD